MRLSLLWLTLLTLPVLAAEPISLRNDREGETYYSSGSNQRALAKATKQVDPAAITNVYKETLKATDPAKICSFDLNASIQKKLKEINPKFSALEGAILYLRSQNEYDDVVTGILLRANDIKTSYLGSKKPEELFLPSNPKAVDTALDLITNFEKKLKNTCFDDAYRSLFGEIVRLDKDLKSSHVEALLVEAKDRRLISFELYSDLERARANQLENTTLSLKTYAKKIQTLRTQFPLRDPNEKSNFITQRADKLKMSYRQRLLETYSELQIIVMANVVKKLRTRLEAPKAEIHIFDRSNNVETIELEPMERFRLAIKLLRKEMALLALNTYFNGMTPGYMDIMAAAYEVGMIPASELEEVASIQEIWNPKKTFWDKAQVWVRTLSSVATVVIPPPYGFIPALAVVVIEMTAGKKDEKTEDPTVLF